jgi:hypothetical protein
MEKTGDSYQSQWGDPSCFPIVAKSSDLALQYAVCAVACGLVVPADLREVSS